MESALGWVRKRIGPDFSLLPAIFLALDFKQICDAQSDESKYGSILGISDKEAKKFVLFFNRVGFRPARDERHSLNFRLRIVDETFLRKLVVRIERRSGLIEICIQREVIESGLFNEMLSRLLIVMRNYGHGIGNILNVQSGIDQDASLYLNLGDGGNEYDVEITSEMNFYAFARRKNEREIGLIPDSFTLFDIENEVNFAVVTDKQVASEEYRTRSKSIFWRGATTGRAFGSEALANPRIAFCQATLSLHPLVDAKITKVVQFKNGKKVQRELKRLGLMSRMVEESEFSRHMAYIDLDGNSTAWGTFRKYLQVVHVIKPLSEFSMFYHLLEPADAFTSIRGTSHLIEKLKNDENFANNFEVAWNGYQFALGVRDKIRSGEATIFPSSREAKG